METRNKYLLLWSSLGVIGVLLAAAVEENILREWRRVQGEIAAKETTLDPGVRQIVATRTGRVDRCITCHVGMDPGDRLPGLHALSKPHPPLPHDVAEFGCTVCHGGQGRATEKADAHGNVAFWPEPMLPREFIQAGCGSCHTQIGVPTMARLEEGRRLVEQYDCLSCHRLDGRGGTLRPGGLGGMEGPDLSLVGRRGFDAQWYQKHRERSREAKDLIWKNAVPEVTEEERALMEGFLRTRVGIPEVVHGQALFHSLGCRGCHKISGVGGTEGPDLTAIGLRDPARLDFTHVDAPHTLAAWLSAHTRDPALVVPGSKMPKFSLTDRQIESLTYYMLSLRRGSDGQGMQPQDRIVVERLGQREFATDGETLYAAFCSACHGPEGEGRRFAGQPPAPAVGHPDFLGVADDGFLTKTIENGRPGRRMPAFSQQEVGLTSAEIAAIVDFLRNGAGVPSPTPTHGEPRWVKGDAVQGKLLYQRWCAGCHGQDGSGPEAPALHQAAFLQLATDDYLVNTIRRGRRGTAMQGFADPSVSHPVLSDGEIEDIVTYIRTWETSP